MSPYELDQIFSNLAAIARSAAGQARNMASAIHDLRACIAAGLPHELLQVTRREAPQMLEAMAELRLAVGTIEAEAQAMTKEAAEALKEIE